MARTPIDDPTESRQRGIGSLPAAVQLATFLPVGPEHPGYDRFMELSGLDPRLAWEETGLFSGDEFGAYRDVVPMREISDAGARLILENVVDGTGLLGDILDHPELFAAVPELANIPVNFHRSGPAGLFGGYLPEEGIIDLYPETMLARLVSDEEASGRNALGILDARSRETLTNEMLSTLLHEAQHAVQEHFGLPSGANLYRAMMLSDEMGREGVSRWDAERHPGVLPNWHITMRQDQIDRLRNDMLDLNPRDSDYISNAQRLDDQMDRLREEQEPYVQYILSPMRPEGVEYESTYPEDQGLSLFDIYHYAPGEVVARNVQNRREKTPEELAQSYPGDTRDITDPDLLRSVAEAYDLIQFYRGGF